MCEIYREYMLINYSLRAFIIVSIKYRLNIYKIKNLINTRFEILRYNNIILYFIDYNLTSSAFTNNNIYFSNINLYIINICVTSTVK